MACHTVHYDTTVLGRLVPFVSVSIVMLPGPRRSARDKAAKEKAMKESKEGAARDTDAEDAAEDSDGPGPDPGRAQNQVLNSARGRNYFRLVHHRTHGHATPLPPRPLDSHSVAAGTTALSHVI